MANENAFAAPSAIGDQAQGEAWPSWVWVELCDMVDNRL
jgi:hypothetical protein